VDVETPYDADTNILKLSCISQVIDNLPKPRDGSPKHMLEHVEHTILKTSALGLKIL
jgi:hypothetical protein